jgi:DNA-binding LacI/PurR family transcriptional regulator
MVNREELKLVRRQTVQEQVYRHLRERFQSGHWPPDSKLPSTLELAQRWGTQPALVHQAMVRLVKEGYLMRRRGLGTFVRDRARRLACLGVYYPSDIWGNAEQHFFRVLHHLLLGELGKRKIVLRTCIDSRPTNQQGKAFPELLDAVNAHQIEGVLVPFGSPEHLPWFNRLTVPVAFLSTAPIPNRATFDLPQLARLSLEQLAARGCRSAGLISMTHPFAANPDGSRHEYMRFLEQFVQTAADLGIRIKDEWMRLPQVPAEGAPVLHERFGYEQLQFLLALADRPAGLVVNPDSAARGVILGLLEKQVRLPQELQLVVHRNRGIDLLCPLPAVYIESDPMAAAQALTRLIDVQFRGEQPEPITIPYRVVNAWKGDGVPCTGSHAKPAHSP